METIEVTQQARRAALEERLLKVADLCCANPLPGELGDVAYDLLRKAAAQIAFDRKLFARQPDANVVKRVALAIENADCGYSITLVRLVDGEATYEAKCAGQTRKFPDHESASGWIGSLRAEARARAAIAAMGGQSDGEHRN